MTNIPPHLYRQAQEIVRWRAPKLDIGALEGPREDMPRARQIEKREKERQRELPAAKVANRFADHILFVRLRVRLRRHDLQQKYFKILGSSERFHPR